MGAFWGLLPVYARGLGLHDNAIATYMSVGILGGAALQWPLGRLSDRHDRRIALALVGVAAAALAVLTPMLAQLGSVRLILIFLFGGMAFAVYPIVVAHLVDHLPPEDLLAASSSVLLLNGVGSALGPLLAGALMSAAGAGALFGWFAATHAAIAAYAFYRYRVFRREQSTERNFRPMLKTTPTAFDLLPENDVPEGTAGSADPVGS